MVHSESVYFTIVYLQIFYLKKFLTSVNHVHTEVKCADAAMYSEMYQKTKKGLPWWRSG